MRLVTGGLVFLLDRFKANPRAATEFMVQIAEAISHAHAGILHRDLKPAKYPRGMRRATRTSPILVRQTGRTDIEITQSKRDRRHAGVHGPGTGSAKRGGITTATDIYGPALFSHASRQSPFSGESVVETLDAVRHAPPSRPSGIAAGIPRDLETICPAPRERSQATLPSAQGARGRSAGVGLIHARSPRAESGRPNVSGCGASGNRLAGCSRSRFALLSAELLRLSRCRLHPTGCWPPRTPPLADANRESEQRFSLRDGCHQVLLHRRERRRHAAPKEPFSAAEKACSNQHAGSTSGWRNSSKARATALSHAACPGLSRDRQS